jgi:hypothetical protein
VPSLVGLGWPEPQNRGFSNTTSRRDVPVGLRDGEDNAHVFFNRPSRMSAAWARIASSVTVVTSEECRLWCWARRPRNRETPLRSLAHNGSMPVRLIHPAVAKACPRSCGSHPRTFGFTWFRNATQWHRTASGSSVMKLKGISGRGEWIRTTDLLVPNYKVRCALAFAACRFFRLQRNQCASCAELYAEFRSGSGQGSGHDHLTTANCPSNPLQ